MELTLPVTDKGRSSYGSKSFYNLNHDDPSRNSHRRKKQKQKQNKTNKQTNKQANKKQTEIAQQKN